MGYDRFSNFTTNRYRKVIHYSLILCLLVIQLLIGGYFYNEFISREKLQDIQRKIQSIKVLEQVTDGAKDDLSAAQNHLQNYITGKDRAELKAYFVALAGISKNLDILEKKRGSSIYVDVNSINNENPAAKYRKMLDSTFSVKIRQDPPENPKIEFPSLSKYDAPDLNFDNYNIETRVFSDTLKKKKGLFGRLRDAIKGAETTKKDSTVVIMKPGARPNSEKLKSSFDSIISAANSHYAREIIKLEHRVASQQSVVKNDSGFYSGFSALIGYSNRLIGVYGRAVKDSKADLTAEYERQNSKSNRVRKNLVLAAMVLMFAVSVLIFLLTRLAFIYERKLNLANIQIKENLSFKNRVLGMLSHELRAPLKIIDIFIRRIQRKTDDPEVAEYLKSISFTNNSVLIQAEQILEYTKNQHIVNKLVPVTFNLNYEISSILAAIAPYVEARHNVFSVEKNIDSRINVCTDNAKIHQLYLNIIGNANKFTENGTISVKAYAQPVAGGKVEFSTTISDSGAGISQSDLDKIFEPYYQGVLSGDIENIGAGLGLSLCREIIELFSGSISVESTPLRGTTVHFTIILNQDDIYAES